MSPPGRPKGESPSAQREGRPTSPPGRPKGESPSAQREGSPVSPVPGLDLSQPISGPAYSRGYRIGASVVLVLIAVQAWRAWDEMAPLLNAQAGWVLGAGAAVLLGSYALLLRSTTVIDATGLQQTGLIDKKIAWNEIRQARLRGFGFARRLVVSTGYGKFRAFYGGTPQLQAAFAAIAARHAQVRPI